MKNSKNSNGDHFPTSRDFRSLEQVNMMPKFYIKNRIQKLQYVFNSPCHFKRQIIPKVIKKKKKFTSISPFMTFKTKFHIQSQPLNLYQ